MEGLYGPLAYLLHEGRRTFHDLLETLGRNHVFNGDAPLPDHELKTWLFWAETEFLPRNEKIKDLLMKNAHLVDANTLPASYIAFLDHTNSWAVNHRRWKEQQVAYSWHSKINWPIECEEEVLDTFADLNVRHFNLLGILNMSPEPYETPRIEAGDQL